ncbi:MAG: FAD-dependent oxidoreductase [Myxococcota bacterium]|jgi:2,4-dienoyl-CoA reductase (NADPH2)
MEYRHLFKELDVGPMKLKNRIAMPAIHLGYEDGGELTDRFIEFYRARAVGGAGLLTVGGAAVSEAGGGAMMMGIHDDRFIPGLKKLVAAIHSGGSRAGVQLYHGGRYSYSFMFGVEPVAPSALASRLTRIMPHELTTEEVREVVKQFGDATGRAAEAGFDLVEAIGSAGYLICQFISPITNLRTDEYGGTLDNRMRFAREVIAAIKKQAGDKMAVIVRIAGNEFMGGHDYRDDVLQVARMYEEAGVHALNVTGGWHESRVPQITGHLPAGGYAYLARDIREVVRIPVFASNRIGDPHLAEKILRKGFADIINMARPLMADPELPNKVRTGRESEIRPCISCNQECLDNVFNGIPTGCTANPESGCEGEYRYEKAPVPRRVAIIGGGPAGCEAARAAALRGHEVELFEKSARIGGQLFDASRAPGKGVYRDLAAFHSSELKRLGIKVRLQSVPTPATLGEGGFDAVVVATGSSQVRPPIPGVHQEHVVFARDVLEGHRDWTEDVVIIGAGGVGLDTAHFIADEDTIDGAMTKFLLDNDAEPVEKIRKLCSRARRRITVVDMLEKAGKDVGRSTKWVILQELRRLGVEMIMSCRVVEIGGNEITVEYGGARRKIPATTVIIAAGAKSDNELAAELKPLFKEVLTVGDAVSPRNITQAIREGLRAGLKV